MAGGGALPSPRSGVAWVLLAAIVLAAGVARGWALDFGLPHTGTRPDESRIVGLVVGMFDGDLNPHFFKYGSLFPYLIRVLCELTYLFGRGVGWYGEFDDFVGAVAVDPSRLYLLARSLSVALGTATVLVTYGIARALFDRTTALIAAFFLALAYLHVRDSHFGATDVSMTFFIALSFLGIVRCTQTPTVRTYAWAGAFAGLATATKYAGAFLVVPLCVAHLRNLRRAGPIAPASLADRRLAAFVAALLLSFAFAMPYALLDFGAFVRDVVSEAEHLAEGHGMFFDQSGWAYHATFSLWFGLGAPLLLASLAGGLLLMRRAPWRAALLLSFIVVYYAVIGRGETVFVRYVVPLVPFLCIVAAFACGVLARAVSTRFGEVVGIAVAAAVSVGVVAPSALSVWRFDALLAREDTRLRAARWLRNHAPSGSTVVHAGSRWGALELPETASALEAELEAARWERPIRPARIAALEARLGARREPGAIGFETWSIRRGGGFVYRGVAQAERPDYVVLEDSPLVLYSSNAQSVIDILPGYRPMRRFDGTQVDNPHNYYDHLDAFFIPYAGFRGVERPGPNLYVYERIRSDNAGP